MSFYNMLFGMNRQADLLLAVIGLRKVDVERFRDVHTDGDTIGVYTRTGGGNRDGYPNEAMRARPEWIDSEDDDYDSTYCTDTFRVPEQWREDVRNLGDILKHGLRAEFAQHLAATLCREPTDADKEQAAHDEERRQLARTAHENANGHTFVPHDDSAMEQALKIAEANGGKLRSFWGIMPLALVVERDSVSGDHWTRVQVRYDYKWSIDDAYWEHCRKKFAGKYPKAMAEIEESVRCHKERRT